MRLIPLLALLFVLAPSAHAARSYDSCTGFITTLPAIISTQGTYCFNKDLATSMASGEAIVVAANNVTVDCNGFKLGGLGAGLMTETAGLATVNRLNTTIRDCNVRGFHTGIIMVGGGGHTIEDNRIESSTVFGIRAEGTSGVIRRNRLTDNAIGDVANAGFAAFGMYLIGSFDVIDNTIDGVAPTGPSDGEVYGIYTVNNPDGVIDGNRIRGLVPFVPDGPSYGIFLSTSGRVLLRGNEISGGDPGSSIGIRCADATAVAAQNLVSGFVTGVSGCQDGENWVSPL